MYKVNIENGYYLFKLDDILKEKGIIQAVCPGFIDSHFHESAEMHMDKSRKGLFGFRDPDAIVADAMKDFAKKKVISGHGQVHVLKQNRESGKPDSLFCCIFKQLEPVCYNRFIIQ